MLFLIIAVGGVLAGGVTLLFMPLPAPVVDEVVIEAVPPPVRSLAESGPVSQ